MNFRQPNTTTRCRKSESPVARAFHRWYARTYGYFWLPCEICGRYAGGHEWGGASYYKDKDPRGQWHPSEIPVFVNDTEVTSAVMCRTGHGVCPWCEPLVRRLEEVGEDPLLSSVRRLYMETIE